MAIRAPDDPSNMEENPNQSQTSEKNGMKFTQKVQFQI
jgi:hypothetical protein